MIAKIIKGTDFGGVVSYMLGKREGEAKILQANGVRSSSARESASDFALQASMRPNVKKCVCHTILSFSAHDAEVLSDTKMVEIANEYLRRMGYGDTQSLIVRHSDRLHPHLHICINRIGNDGKTISDRNEKFRSTKICRELTERYGLTIGKGKQAVNRHRLRGEDKLRYEIFDAVKEVPNHGIGKSFPQDCNDKALPLVSRRKATAMSCKGSSLRKRAVASAAQR